MHFVVICDNEVSIAAAKSVKYGEERRAVVALFLEVRGGNIITRAKKTRNSVAANTVLITIVPHTVRPEAVFFVRRMIWKSFDSISLTSPFILALLDSSWIFVRHAFLT